jgi:DNA-binding protein YbaB
MFDQAKLALQAKKIQKELANEIIEVSSGAVTVKVNAEQKLKSIKIDEDNFNGDFQDLERSLEESIREAYSKAQSVAAEKLKPIMGQLGNFGV